VFPKVTNPSRSVTRPVSPGQIVLSHGAAANKSQFERPTFEGGDKQRFSDPVMGDAVLPAALNWLLITVALNDQEEYGRGITNSPLNDHYCSREAQWITKSF
jgi:hypothetical protein